MKQNIKTILTERFDDEKYQKILMFLRNPEVIKMKQQENPSKTQNSENEIKIFFSDLQENPPTRERKNLIEQLDKLKNSSFAFIDYQVTLFQAITYGMQNIRGSEQKMADEQLNQLVLDMRRQATPHIQQHVWMGMLYSFRDKENSELRDMILLHKTIEGKLGVEFIQSVFRAMYQQMTVRLQSALETEFNPINSAYKEVK